MNHKLNKKEKALLDKYNSDKYAILTFDRDNLPEEGDTISVGNLTATFKKNK